MNSATSVGITLGELLSVAAAIVAALWMLGKIGLSQFKAMLDARFASIDAKLRTFDSLHEKVALVDKDLVQVRLEMATHYVRQEGIRVLQTRMEQLFTEIFDKLDNKQDKLACPPSHHHGQ